MVEPMWSVRFARFLWRLALHACNMCPFSFARFDPWPRVHMHYIAGVALRGYNPSGMHGAGFSQSEGKGKSTPIFQLMSCSTISLATRAESLCKGGSRLSLGLQRAEGKEVTPHTSSKLFHKPLSISAIDSLKRPLVLRTLCGTMCNNELGITHTNPCIHVLQASSSQTRH